MGALPPQPLRFIAFVFQGCDATGSVFEFKLELRDRVLKGVGAMFEMVFLLKSKRGDANMAPHPCKTSCAARVAPQRCPILHMSKSRIILQPLRAFVNRLQRSKSPPFIAV